MTQNRKQSTLKLNQKQTKKLSLYELREGGKEGRILTCTYMYMCTHIATALASASVYIGPILVCIYLRIVLKSEHV